MRRSEQISREHAMAAKPKTSFHDCSLGYNTEMIPAPKGFEGAYVEMKPLEPCPKPKTFMELYKSHHKP